MSMCFWAVVAAAVLLLVPRDADAERPERARKLVHTNQVSSLLELGPPGLRAITAEVTKNEEKHKNKFDEVKT